MKIRKKYRKFADAVILLAAALLFTLLVKVVDVQPIGPQETSVGFAKVNKAFADLIGTNMLLYKLTQLLGYAALAVVAFFGFGGSGENTTAISAPESHASTELSGDYYTLDGRKLQGKPTQKGIYVRNGRKIIIK